MSRHRIVRSMNLEEEIYDDDDELYSRSVEDSYCISPSTAAQFTWNRDRDRNVDFAAFMGREDVLHEEDELEEEEEEWQSLGQGGLNDSATQTRLKLNDVDRAKLNSCLEEVRNIIGEHVPESIMEEVIVRNKFNLESSLNELLSQQEKPKPKREPRQNRRNRQDGCDCDYHLSEQMAYKAKLQTHSPSTAHTSTPDTHNSFHSVAQATPCVATVGSVKELPEAELLHMKADTRRHAFDPGSDPKADIGRHAFDSGSDPKAGDVPAMSLSDLAGEWSGSRRVSDKAPQMAETGVSVKAQCGKLSHTALPSKPLVSASPPDTKLNLSLSLLLPQSSKVAGQKVPLAQPPQGKSTQRAGISLADLVKQSRETSNQRSAMVNVPRLAEKPYSASSPKALSFSLAELAKRHREEEGRKHSGSDLDLSGSPDLRLGTVTESRSASHNLQDMTNSLGHMSPFLQDLPKVSTDKMKALRPQPAEDRAMTSQLARLAVLHSKDRLKAKGQSQTANGLNLSACLKVSKHQSSGRGQRGPSHFSLAAQQDENETMVPMGLGLGVPVEEGARAQCQQTLGTDLAAVSQVSAMGMVFCKGWATFRKRKLPSHDQHHPVKYKKFSTKFQLRGRKLSYQFDSGYIAPYDFSSPSPDDIIKEKQKSAFRRSDKEFA